jgi:hypothetical protein
MLIQRKIKNKGGEKICLEEIEQDLKVKELKQVED